VDIIACMNANDAPQKTAPYLLLLALQILGAVAFIWQTLPEFRHIAINPGEPIPRDDHSDLIMVGVLLLMQTPFWCRVRLVPIPFRYPSALLQHVFHFSGSPEFHIRQRAFWHPCLPASSRTRTEHRTWTNGRTRPDLVRMSVRIVLHQPRTGTAGAGFRASSKLSWQFQRGLQLPGPGFVAPALARYPVIRLRSARNATT
jgi:hypothetical protein